MKARTYIALLYSIGIGGGRRLVMSDWRSMMEDISLRNPRTFIATGNALFESEGVGIRDLESRLEEAFEKRFGRRVDTIVRAAAPFLRLKKGNPFVEESGQNGSRVMVRIMRQPLKREILADLKPYLTRGERVEIVGGDLWVHFPQDPMGSRLVPVLGSKRLGIGTTRNWNTVRRIAEMLDGDPE